MLQERALLEASLKKLGLAHRDTLIIMDNQAQASKSQGVSGQAQELQEAGRTPSRRFLGDENPRHGYYGESCRTLP